MGTGTTGQGREAWTGAGTRSRKAACGGPAPHRAAIDSCQPALWLLVRLERGRGGAACPHHHTHLCRVMVRVILTDRRGPGYLVYRFGLIGNQSVPVEFKFRSSTGSTDIPVGLIGNRSNSIFFVLNSNARKVY